MPKTQFYWRTFEKPVAVAWPFVVCHVRGVYGILIGNMFIGVMR